MKHAKKMMLVEFDDSKTIGSGVLGRTKIIDVQNPVSIIEKQPLLADSERVQEVFSELDEEVLKVLQNKKLSDYEKIKFYNDLIRRFVVKKREVVESRKRIHEETAGKLADDIIAKIKKQGVLEKETKLRNFSASLNTTTPFRGFTEQSIEKQGLLTRFLSGYKNKRAVEEENNEEKLDPKKERASLSARNLSFADISDSDTIINDDEGDEETSNFATPNSSIQSWTALSKS